MVNRSNTKSLLKSGLLGRWITQKFDIWQLPLVLPTELGKLGDERGLKSISSGDYIKNLWQMGLLRADLIESDHAIESNDITFIEKDKHGQYYYSDAREIFQREGGWGGAFSKFSPPRLDVRPFFHPFRYYVLYQLDRVLRLQVHPLQLLASTKRFPKSWDVQFNEFEEWSATIDFSDLINRWNDIASLAIAAEPITFAEVFGVRKGSVIATEEEYQKLKDSHWDNLKKEILSIGIERIEEARRELCINAEILDPNKNVHTMLRLTQGESRLQTVKGKLGGSIYLLTMAEMIRRTTEKAFGIELREEDELGFGLTPLSMKKSFYGTDRLLDSDAATKNLFLRTLGLDYGVRLRWYVEGDTEYSAIDSVLGRYTRIEIKNLKGNIVAKGGKGVSFRDDLKGDLRTNTFSFISLDSDSDVHLRAVRKAAEDDEICGMFFVSDPDFEFANFTIDELTNIAWEIAVECGAKSDEKDRLFTATSRKTSAKEFLKSAQQALPSLLQLSKGNLWGEKLIRFAWEHPEITGSDGSKKVRPIVTAINLAIKSATIDDYYATRTETRVDPQTGMPISRRG